ncbi:mitochondrial carrier domain-containing protein [Limtongia smithiae]|uniref:mitochondrial carrier domain-containing protein n=1 Tax=Limtongia smithiae TaxID=1125753 RepID=UPI0034D01E49
MPALSKEPPLPPWGYALSGATGAVLANIIVYPIDIVKTKLQVQKHVPASKTGELERDVEKAELEPFDNEHYANAFDALRKIYKKGGIEALYTGMPGALLGVASTNFAYFYWYGLIRSSYQKRFKVISTAMELAIGAVAGAIAQVFTIPVSVITTRQQTSDSALGFWSTGKEVVTHDGPSGLWRGLKASLVLVVNPSITYGMYQRFRELIYPDKPALTAFNSFLLGALSKSMATVSTQPLIISKVMLQSTPKPGEKRYGSFVEALMYLAKHEGLKGLFKGIGPQISKGILVQGLLFMFRDQIELLILLLFRLARSYKKNAILPH